MINIINKTASEQGLDRQTNFKTLSKSEIIEPVNLFKKYAPILAKSELTTIFVETSLFRHNQYTR